MEQNQNTLPSGSDGDSAQGSLAVTAAEFVPVYQNGMWTTPPPRSRRAAPAEPSEPAPTDLAEPAEPEPEPPEPAPPEPAPPARAEPVGAEPAEQVELACPEPAEPASAAQPPEPAEPTAAEAPEPAAAESPAPMPPAATPPASAFPARLPATIEAPSPASPLVPALAGPAGFEPLPLRARHDGWTPARQRRFLEELAECGIVAEAAARVGMSRQSAWQLRRRSEGSPFHSAFEHALKAGMKRIHAAAFERAIEGVERPVFYRGERIGEYRIFDNHLLLALLGKAGEPFEATRAMAAGARWEDYLEAVEQGYDRPQPTLAKVRDDYIWRDEDGIWWTYYPPPAGQPVTEEGECGDEEYRRTLTEAEIEKVKADAAADREKACAERDRFFGFGK